MLRDPGLIPLSRDHQHALALCVLVRRALRKDGSAANAVAQAARIVQKFDSEIRDHFVFEEKVLFPKVMGLPELAGVVTRLLEEHVRLIGLVDQMRTNGDRAVIEEFCATLERHVHLEERVLFEETQRLLSREQLDRIGKAKVHV